MDAQGPRIAVLGASGLIGQAVAEALRRQGFAVTAVARRFTNAQAAAFGADAVTAPIADLAVEDLEQLLGRHRIDVVMNCLGVLQDGPRGRTTDLHGAFVARLLAATAAQPRPVLLIHVSIPGAEGEDRTPFSRTKREGERLIMAAPQPFVILRPGFVIAPAAYGGSALLRAVAALPAALPDALAGRPFAAVAVADIAGTVAVVARRWQGGERGWGAVWDVMEARPATVGAVIEAFRRRFGGPPPRVTAPVWLLRLGAWAGDVAARLGWGPPVRTTALREMERGVEGEPAGWMRDTGLAPASMAEAIAALPSTVQERWFARMFLAKPLVVGSLTAFWLASGLVALTLSFPAAAGILHAHGLPSGLAEGVTVLTSLADILVGLAIGWRRTCRAGLLAGIALALDYAASGILVTPELWIDPLGPLVKIGPAVVLMLVALLMLDDR